MDSQFLPPEPKKDTSLVNKRQIERGAVSKAIYMVTDLFDEKEPLKQALREVAVLMLQRDTPEALGKLRSLLVLSKEVGLISQINTEILLRAIGSIEETQYIKERNLDISSVLKVEKIEDTAVQAKEKMVDEEMEEIAPEPEKQRKVTEEEGRRQEDGPGKTDRVAKPTAQPPMVAALDIGARRKKILEVVRSKGQATIHEFVQSIQGCSSKTIQRELTSLVLSGTLKKTGERRWSKYSLR